MKFDTLYKIILENSAPRSYSCLMLDTSFLSEDICEMQEHICQCDIYDDEPGHGLEQDFHITVLYGLHTEKLKDVTDKVDLHSCIFKLGKLSLFTNDKFDVLKFDIRSKDLIHLNKQLCEEMEYTTSYPDYHPHMTVAYLKPGTGKKYTKISSDIIGQKWESDVFVFSDKSSNKTHYRC